MRALITDALVAELQPKPPASQLLVWDAAISGFGVLIGKRRRSYFVNWRDTRGHQHRRVIGLHGAMLPDGLPLDAERARALAQAIFAREAILRDGCPLCGHKAQRS